MVNEGSQVRLQKDKKKIYEISKLDIFEKLLVQEAVKKENFICFVSSFGCSISKVYVIQQ